MKLLTLVMIALFSAIAFAQVAPISSGDEFQALVALIGSWGAMSPIARGISIVFIGTALLGRFSFGMSSGVKRLMVTILGVVSGILTMIFNGGTWYQALIVTLASSGGAVAIYEAVKGLKQAVKKD